MAKPGLEFRPFPQIPRWQTSVEDGVEVDENNGFAPDEPALEGLPQSPENSIFLSTPGLIKAAELALGFKSARKHEEQKQIAEKVAVEFINKPRELIDILDALNTFSEVNAYGDKKGLKKISKEIEKATEKLSIPADATVAERWLSVYAESGVYRNLAETILINSLRSCHNESSFSEMLYNLALGGLRSSNEKIVKKTIQILTFFTPILPLGGDMANLYARMIFSEDSDISSRGKEVERVVFTIAELRAPELIENIEKLRTRFIKSTGGKIMTTLGGEANPRVNEVMMADRIEQKRSRLTPEEHAIFQNEYEQAVLNETVGDILKSLEGKTGAPQSKLAQLFIKIGINSFRDFDIWRKSKRSVGELAQWIVDISAEELTRQGEPTIAVHFPGVNTTIEGGSPEKMRLIFKKTKDLETKAPMEDEKYWQTFAHLLPSEFDKPEDRERALSNLRELNVKYAEDLSRDTMHLLSPRGDIIAIEDPMLTGLGITKIEFHMDDRDKRDTEVTLYIGNVQYKILLDQYAALRNFKNPDQPITLPLDGEFIRAVILAYAHAVRCTEFPQEENGGEGEGKNKIRGGRRAHLRILPKRNKPRREQIAHILKKYGVDILRMNAERLVRHIENGEPEGEFSLATYVSEVEPLEVGGPPVKLNAPQTTERMRAVLKLPSLASSVG